MLKNLHLKKSIRSVSLKEIDIQCRFAKKAFDNIIKKSASNDAMSFSSIHSFLSHVGIISKILWSEDIKKIMGRDIADILEVDKSSILSNRNIRNSLEHYDNRLVLWIKRLHKPEIPSIFHLPIEDYSTETKEPRKIYIRHYDPITHIFTFRNKELNLFSVYEEIERIEQKLMVFF